GYLLSPILKVWLFMFFLLLCTLPFGMIAQLNFLPAISHALLSDILVQCSLVIIVLSALLMIFKVFPALDFYTVFIRKEYALTEFFKGTGVGVAIMLVCAGLLYLNGNVSFQQASMPWDMVCLYLVYFLLVSLFEEFLFRSYPLLTLAERYPVWFAVLVNGLLFMLAHFGNPDVSVLGLINIALAGMFFAVYTFRKQNIAWAVGIHFAWNFTQAVILGYNLSGNKMSGMVKAIPQGDDWLSGGKFGIEGSAFCTVLLVICIAWLIYRNGFDVKETIFQYFGQESYAHLDFDVDHLFERKNFILFIDALDEIGEKENKDNALQAVKAFHLANSEIQIFCSSRNSDSLLGTCRELNFKYFDIIGVSLQQAETFIGRYFDGEEVKGKRLIKSLKDSRILDKLPKTPLT
ncbi:MAG: CPBP family intramembrane metalloprotease, partial [Pedobacter sp.]